MGNMHRTTLSIIRKLRSPRPISVDMLESLNVRDDSMSPTLHSGESIQIDTGGLVMTGVIAAIATDEFVEIRELQIHNGEFYLKAHNSKYPTISMQDFRALYPGAYFAGVVCLDLLDD